MVFDRRRGRFGDRGGFGGRGDFGDRGGFGGRGGFRSSSYDIPKPVKVGEEYDVEIAEVGSKGDGIARIKNFVVFVSGSKKGEKIKIRITDVGGRFATAEKVGAASAAEGAEKKTEVAAENVEAEAAEVESAEAGETGTEESEGGLVELKEEAEEEEAE